jgi:high-affinity iron transporter
MKNMRFKGILLIGLILLLALQVIPVRAEGNSPAQSAEELRTSLFAAQMALAGEDITAAQVALTQAQAIYAEQLAEGLTAASPASDARLQQGFMLMQQAISSTDAPTFAQARAQTWTALLAGGLAVVEAALPAGDAARAQAWLGVREFRTATRLSRPNADATLALRAWSAGTLDTEAALQAVHADLYDTYQARLNESLRDLAGADQAGFVQRRAELAGLAQGYFALLSPAYGEQRGQSALTETQAAFERLARSALAGDNSLPVDLQTVQNALAGFRAAPLSPTEQAQRAGQLLRYLKLVPVEYARGVANNAVTQPLEIQEAVTFYDAAQAAFDDLQDLLMARDAQSTGLIAKQLKELGDQIDGASAGSTVSAPQQVQANMEALVSALQSIMPAEWQKSSSGGDFDVIASMLDQMEAAVRSGEYALAESSRLEAYAILESGPEARLSVVAPQAKTAIEDLFWNGQGEAKGLAYLIAHHAPLAEIHASRQALTAQLQAVQPLLAEESAPLATVTNAAVIVFREGLEAILILASLLASFKGADRQRYRRPMWVGTALAFAATVLTWLLARSILSSLARYGEKLEAAVSLIAVGVLILITNWFFHKTYWTDHLAGFHSKKKSLLSAEAGVTFGLISLGFTSVYREGFEVVLFLQALVLESSAQRVLIGIGVGLAVTLLIGLITFKLQARLPYMQMLVITGVMIGGVLLVMMGKTVHVLQVVGWLPTTPIGGLSLPYWAGTWLGTYATWQGVLLQLAAGLFVVGSYYIAEGSRRGKSASLFKKAFLWKR